LHGCHCIYGWFDPPRHGTEARHSSAVPVRIGKPLGKFSRPGSETIEEDVASGVPTFLRHVRVLPVLRLYLAPSSRPHRRPRNARVDARIRITDAPGPHVLSPHRAAPIERDHFAIAVVEAAGSGAWIRDAVDILASEGPSVDVIVYERMMIPDFTVSHAPTADPTGREPGGGRGAGN